MLREERPDGERPPARAPTSRLRVLSLRRMFLRSVWGLGDQALVSVSGFLCTVLVARAVDSAAFGAFALSYSAIQFANSIQLSFITQPHNVLGAVKTESSYRPYSTTTALSEAIFVAAVAAIAGAAAIAAAFVAPASVALFLALVVAAPGWLLQDFVRRILYTEGRARAALSVDIVGWGVVPFVYLELSAHDALTTPRALFAAGVVSLGGAGLGLAFLRRSFSRELDRSALRANWDFGKWLGVAAIGSTSMTYLYFFLIGSVLGASAAGVVRAAQVVLGPLNVIVLFVLAVMPSALARLRGPAQVSELRRRIRVACVTSAPVTIGYCIAVAVAAETIMVTVYGRSFGGTGRVLALFAAFYLLHWLAHMLFVALAALELTRRIAVTNLVAGAVTVASGIPMMLAWGLSGAVAAMIPGGLTLVLGYWRTYLGAMRSLAGA